MKFWKFTGFPVKNIKRLEEQDEENRSDFVGFGTGFIHGRLQKG
jgi:hypothetical protein